MIFSFKRSGRGRPKKEVAIRFIPLTNFLYPRPLKSRTSIKLYLDEIEALRLVDLEELSVKDAAKMMGISKSSVWRLVKSGRFKLIKALLEGKIIEVVGKEFIKQV